MSSSTESCDVHHQYQTVHQSPDSYRRVFLWPPAAEWQPVLFVPDGGWERAGPHWLGTKSQVATLQFRSLTYMRKASFVTTDLNRTSFNDLRMQRSTAGHSLKCSRPFYLTRRTPHCPPPISSCTYKVCFFRDTELKQNMLKVVNKHLQK